MKFTTTTLLTTALATSAYAATPIPTPNKPYQLRVSASNPAIKNSIVVLKNDGAWTTDLNPAGVFSTGEPRYPYTFTFAPSPLGSGSIVYELKGAVRSTHLITHGDMRAMQLVDATLGADPTSGEGEETRTRSWMVTEGQEGLGFLYNGVRTPKGNGTTQSDFMSAGSMRACKENDIDFVFYWYDGLSPLQNIVKDCEPVSLIVEEASTSATTPSASLPGVPSPTKSGFLTGVTAPATSTPGGNATATGKPNPSPFPGAAGQLRAGGAAIVGAAVGIAAMVL